MVITTMAIFFGLGLISSFSGDFRGNLARSRFAAIKEEVQGGTQIAAVVEFVVVKSMDHLQYL